MENKTLILASGNKGKLKEFKKLLPEYEIKSCEEVGFNSEIEENGLSFYENALIKAKTVSNALNLPAIADDSGLCVNCLGGAPGIFSARYAGDGDSKHNIALLLKNMADKTDRRAKFVSAVVAYYPSGEIIFGQGETFGKILFKEEGSNGFGYDSVFFSDDLGKSLGVASEEEKNSISHRFRALQVIRNKLK